MGITAALRGDSINLRYSSGGKTPGLFYAAGTSPAASVSGSETGMIGSNYIDCYQGTPLRRGLFYPGANLWGGQAFSILFRAARKANGDYGMFCVLGPSQELHGMVKMFRSAGGLCYINLYNDRGQEMLGQNSVGVDATLDVYHDWVMTCDGTTGANGIKIYRDNSLVFQTALSNAATTTKDKNLTQICVGFIPGLVTVAFHVEEFVIWDSVIDPNSVALTSGTGALNGASRTAFVDAASFDAYSNTNPGEANVRQGTAYTNAGLAKTGTLDLPAISDVKSGVSFDNATKTGTYAPACDYPVAGNVLYGVSYSSGALVGTYRHSSQSTKVVSDTEDLLASIKQIMLDDLNDKIAAIDAQKLAAGNALDPVLSSVATEAYFEQSWTNKILQYSPAIFYGIEDVQASENASVVAKTYKTFCLICLVDSGMTADIHKRIARYSRALEEIFCEAYKPAIPSLIKVEQVRPFSFQAELDSDSEVKVGGVTLTITLV